MAKEKPKLEEYNRKRDFSKTSEPQGDKEGEGGREPSQSLKFVVQKHDASRLHYDLRLEMEGVLKSWAVPKGPSLNPSHKRLAVQVEDHPLEYGSFEGVIPEGEYGGGTVLLWDQGTYTCEGDPVEELASGSMKLHFQGQRMKGSWALVLIKKKGEEDEKNWLLIKEKDGTESDEEPGLVEKETESVASGRSLEEIAENKKAKAPLSSQDPSSRKPQLATLVDEPPDGDQWIHEIKFDGYRIMASISHGKATLASRGELDWTDRFAGVAKALQKLPVQDAMLDGEVVALNEEGKSDFGALQDYVKTGKGTPVYFAFDLLWLDGEDLTRLPLLERKEKLRGLLSGQESVRYSDHVRGAGELFYQSACTQGLEGIISKRADGKWQSVRSSDWQKTKCIQRQEFVIAGYTDPGGAREGFGSLVLGAREKGRLVYCGRVGTGFSEKTLRSLLSELEPLARKTSPFDEGPEGAEAKGIHYVEPKLVCEVEFIEWTSDGRLRHPSFKGLREDKAPEAIVIEKPKLQEEAAEEAEGPSEAPRKSEEPDLAGVKLTNPDRVVYPGVGVTKKGLAEYIQAIAPWILPYVAGRPLALVRCPQGHEKECFFQKNWSEVLPDSLHPIDLGDAEGIGLSDARGLVELVQFGVMELHPWGSREGAIEKPDMITFDLDPGPGLEWKEVVEGALAVKGVLEQVGLKSWVKTSGGKGLHVCVPLITGPSWEEVKEFSHGIALVMEHQNPSRYVANMSKAKRKGRIFVDYLRNGRGATSVAAYSPRAREGAPVSVPLDWAELPQVKSGGHFRLESALERVRSQREDPWKDFFSNPQDLAQVLSRNG